MIVDKETSTDMVVREASNVTLTCRASGYPEPYVMWRREDGEDINYNGETGKRLWNNIRVSSPSMNSNTEDRKAYASFDLKGCIFNFTDWRREMSLAVNRN